jgi:hypothetical protein
MSGSCQGIIRVMSYQGHVGVMSGSYRGHVGVISGSCWGHVGVMSGSCWGHVGVIFGLCQVHVGIKSDVGGYGTIFSLVCLFLMHF